MVPFCPSVMVATTRGNWLANLTGRREQSVVTYVLGHSRPGPSARSRLNAALTSARCVKA